MSATNATTNYELPVFIATDKPAWLVDWNGAMNAIDSAIKEAKTAGDNAQSTANTNANNIQTLDGTVTSQGTAIGNLQTAVSGNTGSINTINSLIGNGEPTTTDKTIIGAINEINAQVQSPEADDVSYDNQTSGLTATNVQDAIDELASGGAVSASAVGYDNTTSGLTASNVQGAIDEVVDDFGGMIFNYDSVGGKPQYSTDGGTTWVNFSGAFSVDEVESAELTGATLYSTGTDYTFLSDHEEVLIECVGMMYTTVSDFSSPSFDFDASSTDVTVTEYHNGNMVTEGMRAVYKRHTYHAENVKAGDKIHFQFANISGMIGGDTIVSCIGNGQCALVADYTIFTIN